MEPDFSQRCTERHWTAAATWEIPIRRHCFLTTRVLKPWNRGPERLWDLCLWRSFKTSLENLQSNPIYFFLLGAGGCTRDLHRCPPPA